MQQARQRRMEIRFQYISVIPNNEFFFSSFVQLKLAHTYGHSFANLPAHFVPLTVLHTFIELRLKFRLVIFSEWFYFEKSCVASPARVFIRVRLCPISTQAISIGLLNYQLFVYSSLVVYPFDILHYFNNHLSIFIGLYVGELNKVASNTRKR